MGNNKMKKFIDIVSKDKVSGFEASARNSIANRKQLDEEFELKLKKLTEEKVMKKQTAVQWLLDTMADSGGMEQPDIDRVFKQALEMEKQQIVEAYNGKVSDTSLLVRKSFIENTSVGEQYYNETYGK
jgi:hypothetical protein